MPDAFKPYPLSIPSLLSIGRERLQLFSSDDLLDGTAPQTACADISAFHSRPGLYPCPLEVRQNLFLGLVIRMTHVVSGSLFLSACVAACHVHPLSSLHKIVGYDNILELLIQ